MRYVTLGDTFDVKFTTRKFSTGAPFTLAGSPVVSAYPDNSTTQLTAGITLSVDFDDSVTGLNNVRVVATSGNSYAAGNWALVITTGTVDGVSVVGEVIENFVIGSVPATVAGAVGSVTGNVGGNVTGSVGSLATQAKADVNAEVLDVLNVDTFAQPGQGAPAATTTIRLMLAYLYKAWRNRSTQDLNDYKLYNDDATTVDQKAAVSDAAGTTDVGEVATGP
jgi:hypothetical protein